MNYKFSFFVLSRLIFIEGIFMLISAIVSLWYNENDFQYLSGIGLLSLLIGFLLSWIFRKGKGKLRRREGYFVVTATWILFSLIGALPFYLSHYIPSYTDAFFETMSGFTTTGASILNDIESLPHGLLFWRSIIQWLGGMGIIVLSLAILPILGIGGMQLFVAEVPGPTKDKLHPRITQTAKRLWLLYVGYTAAETLLLYYGGMNWFDAICHSFTTMATGGYSTKQASIAHFNSPFIEYVIIVFMFIAGTNFSLGYFAFQLKLKKIFKNQEFKAYTGIILLATVILTAGLIIVDNIAPEISFRHSFFQVVSIVTTTGFVTADYLKWPTFLMIIIFLLMFVGGSAGSTGGGMKVIRILLVVKNSFKELKRLLHPSAIVPVKYNGVSVNSDILSNILSFLVFYILIFVIGTIIISTTGYDIESSMGAVAATLGNIGPGIGAVGPMENFSHFSVFAKWFLSFMMLVGRLELFTVFVILSPAYWRD